MNQLRFAPGIETKAAAMVTVLGWCKVDFVHQSGARTNSWSPFGFLQLPSCHSPQSKPKRRTAHLKRGGGPVKASPKRGSDSKRKANGEPPIFNPPPPPFFPKLKRANGFRSFRKKRIGRQSQVGGRRWGLGLQKTPWSFSGRLYVARPSASSQATRVGDQGKPGCQT